jgi:hypothetical protein
MIYIDALRDSSRKYQLIRQKQERANRGKDAQTDSIQLPSHGAESGSMDWRIFKHGGAHEEGYRDNPRK